MKGVKKLMQSRGMALLLAVLLGVVAAVALTACGSKDSGDAAQKAKENTDRVEDMEQEEVFVFTDNDTGVTLTKYNGSDSDVEIPEEYDGKSVTAIADTAFADYGNIDSITIPYTVHTIENGMLPESETITLNVYNHSMGEVYAMQYNVPFVSLGENPAQATCVTVYEKNGATGHQMYLGQTSEDEALQGVTFEEKDGKSVLTLDNCDIGSISVGEFAALTIEVKEGTTNLITAQKGKDGISTNGNLTITGAGTLRVFGSDAYSVREGDNSYVGYGICTYGNLTLENHVQVEAKAGISSSRPVLGVMVDSGNLIISESKLEAFAYPGEDSDAEGAAVMLFNYGMEQYGKLELTDAVIAEGGERIPLMDNESDIVGYGIGSEAVIAMTEDALLGEFNGYSGAALYVRVEPRLTDVE